MFGTHLHCSTFFNSIMIQVFVRESNTNVHVVTTSPYNLANHVNAYDHAVVENNHPISGRPTTYWSTRSMAFCCITLKFIL